MKNIKKQLLRFKQNVILVVILLISLSTYSQNSLELKELTMTTFSEFEFKYVGKDQNKYYLLMKRNLNNYTLKAFDLNTDNIVYESKIKLPSNYNSANIVKIKCINDELFILSYFNNADAGKNYIFIETIDAITGMQKRKFEKIAEMEKISKNLSFQVVESPSQKITAVLFIDTKKINYLNSEVFLFDNDYNLIYQIPDCFKNVTGVNMIDELYVTDSSEFIAIFKHSLSKDKEAFSTDDLTFITQENFRAKVFVYKQCYDYKLLYMQKDLGLKTIDIEAPLDSFVKYASAFAIEDKIFVCGTLSSFGNLNNNEIFCTLLNKDDDIIKITNLFKIDHELFADKLIKKDKQLYEAAIKSKSNMLWDYHDLKNAGIVKFNKGYLVLIEKTTVYSQPYQGGTATVSANDYVYVILIDNNYQIKKLDIIPLNQTQIGYPRSNIAYWVKDNHFYFLSTPISYLKDVDNPNMKLLIYDLDLNCEVINIPFSENYKNGIFSRNIWITDDKFIGYTVKNRSLGNYTIFSVKNIF